MKLGLRPNRAARRRLRRLRRLDLKLVIVARYAGGVTVRREVRIVARPRTGTPRARAAAARAGSWTGSGETGLKLLFRISRNRIRAFEAPGAPDVNYRYVCRGGPEGAMRSAPPVFVTEIRLDRRGSFRHESIRGRQRRGIGREIGLIITGKLGTRSGKGTFRTWFENVGRDGSVYRCDSQTLDWTARPSRR
jgi:hypothetical protein